MPVLGSDVLQKIRGGALTLGLGVHHLRGSAVPLLAKAAGYDWLFIDSEHGTISAHDISQICVAALSTGVAPIVRICAGASTRAPGRSTTARSGIVVPHVDTVEQARRLVDAFRFHPMGHRSTGGPPAQFGYRPPPAPEAQKTLNAEILVDADDRDARGRRECRRDRRHRRHRCPADRHQRPFAGDGNPRPGRPRARAGSLPRRSPTPAAATTRCWAWAGSTTRRWRAATSAWARA